MKTELVTTLKRQATKILSELHESKVPVLITEHGKPSAYLVDFEYFESLQHRMQILEGIAWGESAVFEGKTMSRPEAKNKLSKWLS
jgi:prevent-host-death family protein